MYLFSGLIKCLNCGESYRGKKQREVKVYTCSGYQKKGASFCTSFSIKEEEIAHIITGHLQLKGTSINKPLEDYVKGIEVRDRGYRIKYKDKTESVVNATQELYGTKFKY